MILQDISYLYILFHAAKRAVYQILKENEWKMSQQLKISDRIRNHDGHVVSSSQILKKVSWIHWCKFKCEFKTDLAPFWAFSQLFLMHYFKESQSINHWQALIEGLDNKMSSWSFCSSYFIFDKEFKRFD